MVAYIKFEMINNEDVYFDINKIMENKIIKYLYELGLYSDIELVINNKLYKLHKYFITDSMFFKTLIDNINVMSTSEEIYITDTNGIMMDIHYVDNIIKWMYDEKIEFLENLNNLRSSTTLIELTKYYCVVDFLQIDILKEYIKKNINEQIDENNFEEFPYSITKNAHTEDYLWHNKQRQCILDGCFNYADIMNCIYHILVHKNCIHILKSYIPENNEQRKMNICNRYIQFIIKNKITVFTSNPCRDLKEKNESYDDYKIFIVSCMYDVYRKTVDACINGVAQSNMSLQIYDIKLMLDMDVVDDIQKFNLVRLLDNNDWINEDNMIMWEKLIDINKVCIEHNIEKLFLNKVQAYLRLTGHSEQINLALLKLTM